MSFIGTAAAKKAACVQEGDRIKLGDVDVTTKYDADKKINYTNYKCFSFDVENGNNVPQSKELQNEVDDGELDDSNLPF